jgi:hypothetical protein
MAAVEFLLVFVEFLLVFIELLGFLAGIVTGVYKASKAIAGTMQRKRTGNASPLAPD